MLPCVLLKNSRLNKQKMRLLRKLRLFYWKRVAAPISYARHIGVKVGDHCLISTRYWSSEPYLISIGNHVQVTDNVSFHTHGGGQAIRQAHPDFDCFGKIRIDDYAYIGAWSHIMAGCTIGEGALVAAGSVVTKSVPPHTVVGGNPARYICTTEEYYERNKQYDLGIKRKKMTNDERKAFLLSLPEDKFIRKSYIK